MLDLLLINIDYYEDIFKNSRVRSAISSGATPLGLACLAGAARAKGFSVVILDLNTEINPEQALTAILTQQTPRFAGITSTTPLIIRAYAIAKKIKEISPLTKVLAGGPHPTALPEEVLRESVIDGVVSRRGGCGFAHDPGGGSATVRPEFIFQATFREHL